MVTTICGVYFCLFCLLLTRAFIALSQPLRTIKQWYDDARQYPKLEYQVKRDRPSILHGRYLKYDEKGKLQIQGIYQNNRPNGQWTFYYPNGNIKSLGRFAAGNRAGEWLQYHNNDSLKSKGSYSEDKKNGLWLYYAEDGKLTKKGNYCYDRLCNTWQYFYDDGGLKSSIIYYPDEEAWYEAYFEDGNQEGLPVNCSTTKVTALGSIFIKTVSLNQPAPSRPGSGKASGSFITTMVLRKRTGYYKEGKKKGDWTYFRADSSCQLKRRISKRRQTRNMELLLPRRHTRKCRRLPAGKREI